MDVKYPTVTLLPTGINKRQHFHQKIIGKKSTQRLLLTVWFQNKVKHISFISSFNINRGDYEEVGPKEEKLIRPRLTKKLQQQRRHLIRAAHPVNPKWKILLPFNVLTNPSLPFTPYYLPQILPLCYSPPPFFLSEENCCNCQGL